MNKQKQKLLSPENYIRSRARSLPIGDCYISENWRETGFAIIIITRDHINGNITDGVYIVDLHCLGMKESFWKFNQNPLEFKEMMDTHLSEDDIDSKLVKAKYPLVHNIIYGAVAYADELGFGPHKTFELTKCILEEDDERVKLIEIEFGFNGKPLYVASSDNPGEANRVMAHLDKKIGRDNYHFIKEADADDFFEKEARKDYSKIDYHDPLVKKNLISQFMSFASNPKKLISKNMDKMAEVFGISDVIFFEYMVTRDELKEALEKTAGLFDFKISDEIFSDDLLFGNQAVRKDRDEVRKIAGRLLQMEADRKIAQGLDEATNLTRQYPDVPVFQYFYLKFLEMKTEQPIALETNKYYDGKYPGYLPFIYKCAMGNLKDNRDLAPPFIPESLYLKNLYPGKTTFCRHEVLLYAKLLSYGFGLSDDFVRIEMIIHYLEEHYPGIMPNYDIFYSKILRLPKVVHWCESWMKEQA